MDYAEVVAFLTVIRYETFSDAAKALGLSQSALSKRIDTLEHTLGQRLIARRRGLKTFELTDAGFKFIPIAQRIHQAFNDIAAFSIPEARTRLGISATMSLYFAFLRPCLVYYWNSQKSGNMNCRAGQSHDIYCDVENFRTEIGFVTNVYNSPIVETIPFIEWGWAVCCGEKVAAHIDDIRNLPLKKNIIFNWGEEYIKWHKRVYDLEEPAFISIEALDVYQGLLSSGDYWSIAPQLEAERFSRNGLCSIEYLHDLKIRHRVYLVIRKREKLSENAKRFLLTLCHHYASIPYVSLSPEAKALYRENLHLGELP